MTMLLDSVTTTAPEDQGGPGRRRATLLAAAVVAPVVGFVTAYLLFFTPSSPSRLTLTTTREGVEPALDTRLGTWTVAPGSVAGYRVREKLLRLPAPNDAVGRTDAVVGGFELTRAGRQYVVTAGLRVDIDLASLKSDEQRRDDHMRTMAIETDRYPTATFVTTADVAVPESVAGAGTGGIAVTGDLTLHGVTRSLTIPVDLQTIGSQIEVVGSLAFDWELFDIQQPNLSYVTVEDRPTLEFRLFFSHQGRADHHPGTETRTGPQRY